MPRPEEVAEVRRLALPAPDLDLTVDPDCVLLTTHAVQRYRERIEGVPVRLAVRRLRWLVSTSRWQSRPTSGPPVILRPGVIYGFNEACPDACLLLRHTVLVTVLARDRPQVVGMASAHRYGTARRVADGGRRTRSGSDGHFVGSKIVGSD